MNEFTMLVLGGIALVAVLLLMAYLIWPAEKEELVYRNTTSSKNGRGYWE